MLGVKETLEISIPREGLDVNRLEEALAEAFKEFQKRVMSRSLEEMEKGVLEEKQGRDIVKAKLWLMEESANTEVDLIIQAGGTLLFCEVKWLSLMGGSSRKRALTEYALDQLKRQYLCGLYLKQASQETGIEVYHQLTLTSPAAINSAEDTDMKQQGVVRTPLRVPSCISQSSPGLTMPGQA